MSLLPVLPSGHRVGSRMRTWCGGGHCDGFLPVEPELDVNGR